MTKGHEVYQLSRHHMFLHAVSLRLPTVRPGFSLKERNQKMRREGESERNKIKVMKETAK